MKSTKLKYTWTYNRQGEKVNVLPPVNSELKTIGLNEKTRTGTIPVSYNRIKNGKL